MNPINRAQAERFAQDDYQTALGTVIEAPCVYGYREEDSVDIQCDPPARVRVIATPPDDLAHWCDDWLDPYWNVELAEPDSRLDGVRSLWVFAPSYNVKTGERYTGGGDR